MSSVLRSRTQDVQLLTEGRNETMMNESMSFTVLDENGREVNCEALFTFASEETGKSYIVYTDNSVDAEGNTQVYASIYDPESDEQKLSPIETEKEWKIIEIILAELQAEI